MRSFSLNKLLLLKSYKTRLIRLKSIILPPVIHKRWVKVCIKPCQAYFEKRFSFIKASQIVIWAARAS